jgi:putative ABC transport system ATP-binding protein
MTGSTVTIRSLRKTFDNVHPPVHALAGVDIDIQPGAFAVIRGPSGSGKSTLLYLLGGLDKVTSGSIMIDEQPLETLDENGLALFRRRKVGFIFQSFNLVASMSAQDNVSFPLRFSGVPLGQRRARAEELLRQVGLEKRAKHRPTELSGGQQQRVAIARALINNPSLILADEPTGNLDRASGREILKFLIELHRSGRTVVVVTHDEGMLQYATQRVNLLDGKTVSDEQYTAAMDLLAFDSLEEGKPPQ